MICETDLENSGIIRYLPASGYIFKFIRYPKRNLKTTARLAQWDKRRSAEREVAGSNPGRTNTQGL